MDRQTVYRGQIVYETDMLLSERYSYEGLGLLAMDMLGTSTLVAGLPCGATAPASLAVVVGAGRVYAQETLEASAWGAVAGVGGLAADTNANHKILKQALLRDPVTLNTPAPVTTGFSINYLIQASFSEADTGSVVLPFFNASNPTVPWAGPGNSGGSLPVTRQDSVAANAKAGTAAATGTQTTPTPDAGFVGLYVVTVAFGMSAVHSGNISVYGGSPFITETLTQKIGQTTGDARYAKQTDVQAQTFTAVNDTGAANAYAIDPAPAIIAYAKYQRFSFQADNANTGASTLAVNGLSTQAITRRDGTALQAGDIPNNSICDVEYDGGAFQLLGTSVSTSATDIQAQAGNFDATDTGTANAVVVSLSPAIGSLAALSGVPIRITKMSAVNTGATTLAVNGLAAKPIHYGDASALKAGALPAGGIFTVIYDTVTAAFIIQGPTGIAQIAALLVSASNLGANGSISLQTPAGTFTINWGITSAFSQADGVQTAPLTTNFVSACYGAMAITINSAANVNINYNTFPQVVTATLTQIQLMQQATQGASGTQQLPCFWIAWGK